MNENKPSNPFPVQGFAVILLALGVFIIADTPFNPSRPTSPNTITTKAEDVLARLWQDPFAAVELHRNSKHNNKPSIPDQINNLEYLSHLKHLGKLNNQTTPGDSGKKSVSKANSFATDEHVKYQDKHHIACSFYTKKNIERFEKSKQNNSNNIERPINTSAHQIEEVRCQIQRDIDIEMDKEYDLHVLAVMVNAGPYAENKEVRIRSRYAVTTALSSIGYIPSDSEHIGYMDFKERCDYAISSSSIHNQNNYCDWPATIPYEWYKQKNPTKEWKDYTYADNILVIWLDDQEVSGNKPLEMLAKIKKELSPGPHERYITNNKLQQKYKDDVRVKFDVIGPSSSTSLVKMHINHATQCNKNDSLCTKSKTNLNKDLGFKILSPRATLDDEAILKDLNSRNITSDLNLPGFERTIKTDSVLVDNLLCELLRRGINPYYDKEFINNPNINQDTDSTKCQYYSHRVLNKFDKKDYIVLIGEWDTAYSRNFNNLFRNKISKKIERYHNSTDLKILNEQKVMFNKNNKPVINWLYTFNYLRGLDGEIGNTNITSNSSKSSSNSDKEQKEFRRPVGSNQFDYLRRLADQIKNLSELKSETGSIRAIGIVGSDTYDKLLILQALRNNFPDVVFFTTDLDARMLHLEENKWARNLVVASANGLSPKNTVKRTYKGLAFRDSYQTALYNTIQYSVYRTDNKEFYKEYPGNAKIFEIGNNQAVDYSHQDVCGKFTSSNKTCDYNSNKTVYILISLGIFAILLYLTSNQARLYIFSIATIVYSVAFWLSFFDLKNSLEFYHIFTGTSVWPAYIIRMTASVTAILLIIYTFISLKRNTNYIIREHHLSDLECINLVDTLRNSLTKSNKFSIKCLTSLISTSFNWLFRFECYDDKTIKNRNLTKPEHLCRYFISSWSWKQKRNSSFSIDNLFYQYMNLSKTRYWIVRVGLISAVYIILSFLFLKSFPGMPVTFFQDEVSANARRPIMLAALIPYIFLIFLVSDITRLNARFIELLTKYKMNWPTKITSEYCKKYGLSKEIAIEKLKLDLIVSRSKVVDELIFLPFIILTMLILSRVSYFEKWHMPPQLMIIICMGAIIALISAIRLRKSAKKARLFALKNLNEIYYCQLNREANPSINSVKNSKACGNNMSERLKLLIQEIEDLSTGPFLPFSKHPIIAAIAMPFGGVGGLYLIDYLATAS